MPITKSAFIVALMACASLQAATPGEDRVTSIDLGESLRAEIGYDMNCKFLYLPGREVPISIPFGAWIRDAKVSPNRKTILLLLCRSRHDVGSDYFCCLHCTRSDTSSTATWRAAFILYEPSLDLAFDRRTMIEEIRSVSDEGHAILKIAQGEARVPPYRILRTIEDWDLGTQSRQKILEHLK